MDADQRAHNVARHNAKSQSYRGRETNSEHARERDTESPSPTRKKNSHLIDNLNIIRNDDIVAESKLDSKLACDDYFYNYFERGFDVLIDGKLHVVKKVVLHGNHPCDRIFGK